VNAPSRRRKRRRKEKEEEEEAEKKKEKESNISPPRGRLSGGQILRFGRPPDSVGVPNIRMINSGGFGGPERSGAISGRFGGVVQGPSESFNTRSFGQTFWHVSDDTTKKKKKEKMMMTIKKNKKEEHLLSDGGRRSFHAHPTGPLSQRKMFSFTRMLFRTYSKTY
jgi:hypothetical protein